MLNPAFYVVLGHALGAIVLGWVYFRRYRMTRPPIGVLNFGDVVIMIASIVLVPYLYLTLPLWLVMPLVVVGVLSVLYFLWEPVLRVGRAIWPAVLVLAGADIGAMLLFGAMSPPFLAVNNAVLIAGVVGAANLWAQSGMRARDAALLGAVLVLYDAVATSQSTLMVDLIGRLVALPFAPVVAWPLDTEGRWLGIGAGDLMLATVFPLVMRKAFGRAAGRAALGTSLAVITGVLAPVGWTDEAFPVMVVLGPLMVLQYLCWARRRGSERTTWQYLQAEPLSAR